MASLHPDGIALGSCFIKRELLEAAEAAVEEACTAGGAVELHSCFSFTLGEEDLESLLSASQHISTLLSSGRASRVGDEVLITLNPIPNLNLNQILPTLHYPLSGSRRISTLPHQLASLFASIPPTPKPTLSPPTPPHPHPKPASKLPPPQPSPLSRPPPLPLALTRTHPWTPIETYSLATPVWADWLMPWQRSMLVSASLLEQCTKPVGEKRGG